MILINETIMQYFYNKYVDEVNYFKQYTYNKPLFISKEKDNDFKHIQKLLYRCILHFVTNYSKYEMLMPIDPKLKEIYWLLKDVPYKVGTYRTDFVISDENRIKIIEITCRFALNSFFRTGLFCRIADDFVKQEAPNLENEYLKLYQIFLSDFEKNVSKNKRIYVIGGSSKEEGKFVQMFGEVHGYEIIIIPIKDIETRWEELNNCTIVPQFTHEEWANLPHEWITKIHSNVVLNDVRTVIFIHDKRFFNVLNNRVFLSDVLNEEEIDLFLKFLTPSFDFYSNENEWKNAFINKDKYIIKPTNLGKGEGIYYGKLVSEEVWQNQLLENKNQTIIQPYIQQRKFYGFVQEEERTDDFLVGTLLFFNDNYYGPGLIRASSHPITNQGDDRKVAPCAIDGELIHLLNEVEFIL